jgi:hypothetical protein
MGTGGKARLGRDADHSPPSSAEVENEEELYLLSPQAPSWRVAGQIYFLPNSSQFLLAVGRNAFTPSTPTREGLFILTFCPVSVTGLGHAVSV